MRLQGMEAGRGDKDRMGRLLLQQMEEERIRMSTQGCDPNDNTGICGPSKLNSDSNDGCDDFVPQGQEYNCSYYADLDLCGLLDEKYCQASCGRCAQVGSAFGEYIERPALGEVNVRHSASTESVVYDTVSKGDLLQLICGTMGEVINGNKYWVGVGYDSDGSLLYVSDHFIDCESSVCQKKYSLPTC